MNILAANRMGSSYNLIFLRLNSNKLFNIDSSLKSISIDY